MSDIHLVSPARHSDKRWRMPGGFEFAARQVVVPLAAHEVPEAAVAMPLAFMRMGTEKRLEPVAILGLQPEHNLFVTPHGQWVARMVPAVLALYPFVLGEKNGRNALFIDESRGLVEDGPDGEPFFGAGEEPSAPLREILKRLAVLENGREVARAACELLDKHGCVRPWPIKLRHAQGEQALEGFHQADEAAIEALSDADYLALRKAGALTMAVCQLLSSQLLPRLGELMQQHSQADASKSLTAQTAQLLRQHGDTLKFGGLL